MNRAKQHEFLSSETAGNTALAYVFVQDASQLAQHQIASRRHFFGCHLSPKGMALSFMFWNGKCNPTTGTSIAVTAPLDTPGIDFALAPNTVLFFDDFNDAIVEWAHPKGTWSETGGNLVGSSARKAVAGASPLFAGCADCSVEAAMQTAGGLGNRVWLLGWRVDKDNVVELMMKDESERCVLKQRSGRVIVAKNKGVSTINAGTAYKARVDFDGTTFRVYIDDVLLITLPKAAGTSPSGTVGFQAKATTGTFGYISVQP